MEGSRIRSQPKALYCYLLMSLWIFLIVAGMYKYILAEEAILISKQPIVRRDNNRIFQGDIKFKKIVSKYCNDPETITPGSEGVIPEDKWALQGVITVIRHGDRGPLTHVRDIDKINCNVLKPSPLLKRYQEYITNATAAGHAPWAQAPGPFHNFPLLPAEPISSCKLGQLTLVGVQQLLTIGSVLGEVYAPKFGWNIHLKKDEVAKTTQKQDVTEKLNNTNPKFIKKEEHLPQVTKNIMNVDNKGSNQPLSGDIVVHCTRYRRALQSALAFIWAMLGGEYGAGGAIASESPSLAFCSTDCACPAADKYAKMASAELKDRLQSHPAIENLVEQLSKIVSQSPSQASKVPHILEDALLTYICHSAPLPCAEKVIEKKPDAVKAKVNSLGDKTKQSEVNKIRKLLEEHNVDRSLKAVGLDFDAQMEKEKLGYYQQKMMENAEPDYQDVVLVKKNIDGDFNFNGDNAVEVPVSEDEDDEHDEEGKERAAKPGSSVEMVCVRKDQVTGLFAYTDWEMKQYTKSKYLRWACLLRAYGMIRHMVQYILKMVSERKPKFVLFSGHDKTLQYLTFAFGLKDDNHLHIHYGSRMILEVYRNIENDAQKNVRKNKTPANAPLDFYLRVVLNGLDVTNKLIFCKGNNSILINGDKTSRMFLCRIENIIRYIHEDYFGVLNATNFKDACLVH